MKKLYLFFLCVMLFVATLSAQTTTWQIGSPVLADVTATLSNGTLTISGTGAMRNIPNPNSQPWFAQRSTITSLVISEGVTSIGDYSFQYCNLQSATLSGNTLKTIGVQAFNECIDLTDIIIPASVESIGDWAFAASGIRSVNLSANVLKRIGWSAFRNCINLSTITIPASLETVEWWAFGYNPVLTEVVNYSMKPILIPRVFEGVNLNNCTLRVPASTLNDYTKAEDWKDFNEILPIDENPAMEIKLDADEVYLLPGATTLITATVTGGSGYSVVTWSSSHPEVASVDSYGAITAHRPGTTLISASVNSESASCAVTVFDFGGDISPLIWGVLEGVLYIRGAGDMPNYSVINDNPPPWYNWRTSTANIDIGKEVTGIGACAFWQHQLISSISIPGSVTQIRGNAFAFCTGLTLFNIPESVTSILPTFLQGCSAITGIMVDKANTAFCSVDGVLFSKDITTLHNCPIGKTGIYTIPETVKIIGEGAFDKCANLTSVILPSTVKSIKNYAFLWCSNITSVTIPASVTEIGYSAFYSCSSLIEFINNNPTPQNTPMDVFDDNLYNSCILRVHDVEAYRNATGWSKFVHIMSIENKIVLDRNEIYLLTGATLDITATVTGSGVVEWNSGNPAVATVNNGTVTGVSPGTAVITATAGPEEAACTVTVIQPGKSTIEGTVNNARGNNVRVNLYMKQPESDTKKGIIGGYVLLATTVPNDNGEYSFEDLPEGTYQVEVVMDDYAPEATDELSLSEEETLADVNFTVDVEAGKIVVDDIIIPITTGAVETWHAASLQIYPNPFTDAVRIVSAVETWRSTSLQIHFTNTAGVIVHTQTITSPDETIHLGHLPSGMYIIRIVNGGIAKAAKLIKIQ